MATHYDVAIIGGGVSGCAIARELSRYRLRVILLERQAEVGFGTTKTNSGIIHAGHHSSPETLKGRLVVRGNALFDQLHEALGFGFRRVGEIVVARTEDDLATLKDLQRLGEEKGVPDLEMWKPKRLQREEPNLSRKLLGALYAPTAGVINPYEFAFALIESAVDNGVELWVDSPVEAIETDPDGEVLHLDTPKGRVSTRFAINAAGIFADHVAALVGLDDFAIHPRKGEEYMLDKRLKGLVRHLVFPTPTKVSKGVLIIPTYDGTLMVGPTADDTDDRYDVSTSEAGSKKIFDFIQKICPAIRSRDTITEFAGLRAVASGNDFIIGPTKVRGFINVAGIQSPGLTAAPAVAEHVAKILRDEGLELKRKNSFRPHVRRVERFASLDTEGRQAAIARDKRFARVICRCELITEAEIEDAIDHGARTLDGIKFRSRAGMGRCQGGFCTSRCLNILSRRLDQPIETLTKRGGGSWLVTPLENAQHPRHDTAAGAPQSASPPEATTPEATTPQEGGASC
ncbi:MAG: NAD(P)/FAD-dependent oxidoreductase [Deltaproteobacteria bacterium]|nr:NAD(P)/FAD-dependent oxidoreductase [Deltaproteobacteria bacterium]